MSELQGNAIKLKEVLVLSNQAIRGLGQHSNQIFLRKFLSRGQHGKTTNKFRNHTEFVKVFSGNGLVEVAHLSGRLQFRTETGGTLTKTSLDDFFNSRECAGSDEENSRGIDLKELLMRVFAATLRGHRGHRSFDNLQESLLHAFT